MDGRVGLGFGVCRCQAISTGIALFLGDLVDGKVVCWQLLQIAGNCWKLLASRVFMTL